MMRYLWCQLAISYTLLTFCAMVLLIVMLYGINDYNDFRTAITLDNVEQHVISEKLTVAQAIRATNNRDWIEKARDDIRENLINLENGSGNQIYRITNSTLPEVYIQIVDRNSRLLISDPVDFPEEVKYEFTVQKNLSTTQSSVKWLTENRAVWLDIPIMDHHDEFIGRLRILFIAEFNLWVQLKSIFDFLLYTWNYVLLLSVPIGIACGLLASHYVTRQLRKMNEVTENWRQGNFDARIALPNDDVLLRHSQYLNDMAQDLELFLRLKENIAVSDGRTRLARELHDTVKQKLFALGLQLATAKARAPVMDASREHILEAEVITREAQHDLMEIITQLRPSGISNTTLYQSISIIAEDFRRRFSVNIELNNFDLARFNAHSEHQVLRVIQESLMNAVRHGKASQIVITGKIEYDIAILTITDNGRGFTVGKKTSGLGITSMRDRVHDLPQGTFDIKSTVGTGTQITLSWENKS